MNTTHFDVLCSTCCALLDESPPYRLGLMNQTSRGYRLHLTLSATKLAAEGGCHLCNLILQSLNSASKLELVAIDFDAFPADDIVLYTYIGFLYGGEANPQSALTILPRARNGNLKRLANSPRLLISPIGCRKEANILGRRVASSGSIGESTLKQLKSWLKSCSENHKVCRNSWKLISYNRKLPTRLLDVTLGNARVITTKQLPNGIEYVTLSHCWGNKNLISLKLSNQASLSHSIPFDSLPKTFRDAIELTRLLGFQYLWIDSLCIVQDSHEDWLAESSRMGEVYSNGILNIAATHAQDSEGGLINQINPLSISPLLFKSEADKSSKRFILYPEHSWENMVERAPLGKRGWVVQERVLSPRVVHFAADQIFWDCCEDKSAELLPPEWICDDGELKKVAPYPGSDEAADPTFSWVYKNWDRILSRYTNCALSFESDKLIALSGLARRVCGQLHLQDSEYVAGLWRPHLRHDLLWRASSGRRVVGRAPSWSWASIEGDISPVEERMEQGIVTEHHTSIISLRIDHRSDNFGPVNGGVIVLQGPVIRLTPITCTTMQHVRSGTIWSLNNEPEKMLISNNSIWWDDPISQAIAMSESVFVLLLATYHIPSTYHPDFSALVLQPTGLKKGQYTRVGIILYQTVFDLASFVRKAKDLGRLDSYDYQSHDSEKGFTVEIE